jgi:hypothetical protein
MSILDYDKGFPTFKKLFDMSDKDLRIKMKQLVGNEISNFFIDMTDITRHIKNEVPNEINFGNYGLLRIDAYGITHVPEYGPTKSLMVFK